MSSVFGQKTFGGPPPLSHILSVGANVVYALYMLLLCSGCWNTKRWSLTEQNGSHVTRDANVMSRRVKCVCMFTYLIIFTLNYGLCNSNLWIRTTCFKFNVTANPLSCYRQTAGTWPWMFCYILPQHARFELLTAMLLRIMAFWGVTPRYWAIPDVSENRRPFQRTWIQNDVVNLRLSCFVLVFFFFRWILFVSVLLSWVVRELLWTGGVQFWSWFHGGCSLNGSSKPSDISNFATFQGGLILLQRTG